MSAGPGCQAETTDYRGWGWVLLWGAPPLSSGTSAAGENHLPPGSCDYAEALKRKRRMKNRRVVGFGCLQIQGRNAENRVETSSSAAACRLRSKPMKANEIITTENQHLPRILCSPGRYILLLPKTQLRFGTRGQQSLLQNSPVQSFLNAGLLILVT